MTTARHEPGWSVAGNGLLISFRWRFLRLKCTLETCSLQSPTLQIEIVRSSRQHAGTPPKKVEPVTASLPAGALPETRIERGPAGSLLSTVICAPAGVGPSTVG